MQGWARSRSKILAIRVSWEVVVDALDALTRPL